MAFFFNFAYFGQNKYFTKLTISREVLMLLSSYSYRLKIECLSNVCKKIGSIALAVFLLWIFENLR